MKLIKNTGNDLVVDELRRCLVSRSSLDIASPAFSLFAFAEARSFLDKIERCRLVIPSTEGTDLSMLGSGSDRPFRNKLQVPWLARKCGEWIKQKTDVRNAPALLPQAAIIASNPDHGQQVIITGNCPFTTDGLGLTPGNKFSLIYCAEGPEESAMLGSWFTALWNSLPSTSDAKNSLVASLQDYRTTVIPSPYTPDSSSPF